MITMKFLTLLKRLQLRVTFTNIFGLFLNSFHPYIFETMAFKKKKVQLASMRGISGLELLFTGHCQLPIRSFQHILHIGFYSKINRSSHTFFSVQVQHSKYIFVLKKTRKLLTASQYYYL